MIATDSFCLFCGQVHEQGDARDGSECGAAPLSQGRGDEVEEELPTQLTIEQLELLC